MATCIYCRRTDPPGGFTREHVIPVALGKFEGALTLADEEVCADCNQYFGDTLDRFLTRDSAEALLRFRHGLKAPAKVREMFRERVRVRLPQDESPHSGIYLDFIPPPPGEREPLVAMIPQLACERKDGKGWEPFTEDELRADPTLIERIGGEHGRVRIVWYDTDQTRERIVALLVTQGIRIKSGKEIGLPETFTEGRRITVQLAYEFDAALARAVAKIAFNYLAKVSGAEFALRPEFDAIRRFIRWGEGRPTDFVNLPSGPLMPDKPGTELPRYHAIALYWDDARHAILTQVSPFNYLVYVVRLCQSFRGVWREVLSGHLFDLDKLTVRALKKTIIAPPTGRAF